MDNIVRGGNWYFGALNAWRVLDEVTLPELKYAGDSFTPAGHMMAVNFPEELEALSASIKLKNNDPQVRALCGREPGEYIDAAYYENLVSYRTGERKGRVITLKGLITEIKQDAVKGMKAGGVDYTFSTIVRYQDIFDGRTIHQYDFFAGPGATIVDGVARYAGMAANLAIAGGVQL